MNVEFLGYQCKVLKEWYKDNNRPALRLVDVVTGEPIAVATINVPELKLGPDEVVIKDYSENRGLLTVLVKAGIVCPTGQLVATGYELSQVCKLIA